MQEHSTALTQAVMGRMKLMQYVLALETLRALAVTAQQGPAEL